MNKLDAVRSVDLFAPLNDIDKALLASEGRARVFEKDQVVCREGELGRTFYVVASGQLAVQKGEPAVEVARLQAGAYLGEMSLLTGEPRTATVVALERAELLELDRPVFLRLFSTNTGLAQALSQQVAIRRVRLNEVKDDLRRQQLHAQEEADIFSRIRKVFGLR